MLSKAIRYAFSLSILSILAPVNVHAESLMQSYDSAMLNDYEYLVAVADFYADSEQGSIERAPILPSLTVEAQHQEFIDAGAEIDGYSVVLQQSLFDLSAWHNYKRGKAISKRAEAQLEFAKQDMILRLAQAYLGALEATDNYRIALAEENAFIDQLTRSKKRHEIGLAAIAEVYEAESVADSAKAATLTESADIGVTFSQLALLTGENYSELAYLKDDFPITKPTPLAENEWVELGKNESLLVKAAELTLKAAKANSRSRRADHLPTITGRVSREFSETNGLTTGFDSTSDAEDTQILLTLRVPLFSGGGVAANRRQAAHQKTSAQQSYRLAVQNAIRSVRSTHLTLMASIASVEARKKVIDSTEMALKSSEAGYKIGTRNLVDVLNAQRSVFQAERNYRAALYNYILNSLTLKQNAGVLSLADLQYLDRWLTSSPESETP
jgi:outer membrane protein